MKLQTKKILITGGTGSFGNKVAAFLESHNPREIVIFSRDEKKQYEMQRVRPNYRYVIGDVRDRAQVDFAMKGIDIVFHAAALKQVPSCESFPLEAVKTNVLGSQNVCASARDNGIEAMVALSTDKAVKPINAMGISKAMMEKIVVSQNLLGGGPVYSCVRYGNVMGSRGSVIPLFLRQIAKKESLTLTDPNMTRFLMTLDQSVSLVLHAFTQARGGEIFVRKAPACTVLDLAKAMLVKYGDGDISRIKVMGVRPGEKMDEVLVNEYEIQRAMESDEFYAVPAEYAAQRGTGNHPFGYEYTSANTRQLTDAGDIGALLDAMGPTDTYQ